MLIYEKIAAIMGEVGAIGKTKKNTSQQYMFRSIDDVMATMQPLFAKHGIFCTSEILSDRTEDRVTSKGNTLIYRVLKMRWTFHASDKSYVFTDVIGEGMDSGDKAANKAMSVGLKYAITQVFMIPTDELKDPEHDTHEGPPIYDGSPKAKEWLGALLKSENVAQVHWRQVDAMLKGKPMTVNAVKTIIVSLTTQG